MVTLPEAPYADNRRAFDNLATGYDETEERNVLLRRMRYQMWDVLHRTFPAGARLLDLGCGTGIDAVFLASLGYRVVATDLSPAMVERTRVRADEAGVGDRVVTYTVGVQEMAQLVRGQGQARATAQDASVLPQAARIPVVGVPTAVYPGPNHDDLAGERFDGIYSNRGVFNCVSDLEGVAEACARLLEPGGRLVVTVIGRACPWEVLYYAMRGRWNRAHLRGARGFIPVTLEGQTVWTRYFTPREFYRPFRRSFELTGYRSLGIFLPPPYLAALCERFPSLLTVGGWIDDHLGGWPVMRDMGDLFLMTLTRRL